MPELPEVETLRIQFSSILIGLKITNIQILKAKSFVGDETQVIGQKIIGIRRFAKMLVIDLANLPAGEAGGLSLVIHLKMSGQLIYSNNSQHLTDNKIKAYHQSISLPNKHTRVIITFTNGDKLFFNDMRIFGWIRIMRNNPITQLSNKPINKLDDLNNLIKNLGPDPLRITSKKFYQILQMSKRPIKVVLMDQEKIGGVGNIYANDALFLSKINPKTPSNKLSNGQIDILFNNLIKVLKEGIKWRGASQNNFRDAYGAKGEKQKHFYIYSRDGEKCMNGCGGIINRIALGGRGTFYCPVCQV